MAAGKEPAATPAPIAFGSLVFDDPVQEKRLSKSVYQALR